MWGNMGVSQNCGYLFGVPILNDYSILGSILGSPYFGKLPYEVMNRTQRGQVRASLRSVSCWAGSGRFYGFSWVFSECKIVCVGPRGSPLKKHSTGPWHVHSKFIQTCARALSAWHQRD